MINNSNISTDSNKSQVQIEQVTQHTQLVFKNKKPEYVIEQSIKTRPDGTIREVLNSGIVRLRNVKSDKVVYSRNLEQEEIQYFREKEAKKELEEKDILETQMNLSRSIMAGIVKK